MRCTKTLTANTYQAWSGSAAFGIGTSIHYGARFCLLRPPMGIDANARAHTRCWQYAQLCRSTLRNKTHPDLRTSTRDSMPRESLSLCGLKRRLVEKD